MQALLLAINKLKVSEEQRKASIDTHEPLLSFALSCGMYSSPAVSLNYHSPFFVLAWSMEWMWLFVNVVAGEDLHSERSEGRATRSSKEFIQASVGLSSKGKLLVPKMVHCYAKSLVEDSNLGVWISKYLPPHQAAFVEQCISQRRQSLLASRNCGILPLILVLDICFSPTITTTTRLSNNLLKALFCL